LGFCEKAGGEEGGIGRHRKAGTGDFPDRKQKKIFAGREEVVRIQEQ
jgi:hypothetical protein